MSEESRFLFSLERLEKFVGEDNLGFFMRNLKCLRNILVEMDILIVKLLSLDLRCGDDQMII